MIRNYPLSIQRDPKISKAAVKSNPMAIAHVQLLELAESEKREIILIAIKDNVDCFPLILEPFRKNRRFILEMIKK